MQREEGNKRWGLRHGIIIGWGMSTFYVAIILFWSLINKNHMLYYFELMSPAPDFMSIFIPIINKHSSQLIEHGYVFEASRSRNLYGMIWLIQLFFSSLSLLYIKKKYSEKNAHDENKISTKLLLAQSIIIIVCLVISFYGIDIDFDGPGRRGYTIQKNAFYYFVQPGSLCIFFLSLTILFDRFCYLIRRVRDVR